MLNKEQIWNLINLGLSTGADFCEIFFEDSISKSMQSIGGEIIAASTDNLHGAGIRLIKGIDEVFANTNDTSYENLASLIKDLTSSFNGEPNVALPFEEAKKYTLVAKKFGTKAKAKVKADKLKHLSSLIKNYSPLISQATARLVESEQHVLICNSKGVYQDDLRVRTRVVLSAISKNEKGMAEIFEGPGWSRGIEIFETEDFDALALDIAKRAVAALDADDIKSQKMPVIIHNGFGGVIFHEACGHPLEATSVAKGLSPFATKVGQKVANDIVTAHDNGTIVGQWGWQSFDDEGTKTKDNVLIEKGILKGFLVDYRNSLKMGGAKLTGSARRQNYKFSPTSRMSTTYIANGDSTLEEIIADTNYGLFAKKLGGGSVNPATGEFNFAVLEGYMVENGKLTKLVKGATLIGKGDDIINKIDRVANNLSFGTGVCGSISGGVPTDVGQPSIRVSELTVGGGGK